MTPLVSEAELWLGVFVVMASIAVPSLWCVVRDCAGVALRVWGGRPRPRPTYGVEGRRS